MTNRRLVVALAFVAIALPFSAGAQIETLTRTAYTRDTAIERLTKQIEALENTIAQLQQKLAFIKSVSPLVLDAGGDLTIRAGNVSFFAQSGLEVRAGTGMSLRSGNQVLLEAAGTMDLKGAAIRHNGGTNPVACSASTVGGQTTVGGGLRGGEHTHAIAIPIAPCSSTVTVPGPGQ